MDSAIREMPEGFGGVAFQDVTNIHPLALAMLVVLGGAMLVVPRRWAGLPLMVMACFVPLTQKVTLAGLDFNILRLMVLIGLGRLVVHREYRPFFWNRLDTWMVLWTISFMVIYSLQQGTTGAFINRLGFGFDSFGMYFLFRCLIRTWEDADCLIRGLAILAIPVSFFFLFEHQTGRNIFSIFGGVPSVTMIRYGKLRCQGAFAHPIMAGCFWGSLMPLFAALWWKSSGWRLGAVAALGAAALVVFCSASSTPVLAVLSGALGGLMFFLRHRMRWVRWGLVILLAGLHLVMKGPVWHLISRVSAVGGSTGYFRYKLIDEAIRNFPEWALLGTASTAHWFYGAQDLCNYYVYQGVMGGALTLGLFAGVIAAAFGQVGRLWRRWSGHPFRLAVSWALGVSVFVHCANFIGLAYVGTITILWYWILAMISSLSVQHSRRNGAGRTTLFSSRIRQRG
jgi:hypothetical protein